MAPGEVQHKSVPAASVRDVRVEEGQQGAVRDRLPPYPQPIPPVQVPVQRGCKVSGEHEEQGPRIVAQSGQSIIVREAPVFETRHSEPGGPTFRGQPPDGGCVAPTCVYLRGLEHVRGVEHEARGGGARMSEDTSPLGPNWGPWAARSDPSATASHG